MEKIRILIADTGEEYRKDFIAALQQEPDIQVVGQTGDGMELLRLVKEHRPDVVVMEMILIGMDGVEVLEHLSALRQEQRPRVLIVSSLVRGGMADLAACKGADHYMTKPCRPSTVCQRVRQLRGGAREDAPALQEDLETVVTNLLLELCVPPHISGYGYLREGIILTVRDPSVMRAVTKILYPEVAKRFHSTAPRVERAIRHAIQCSWSKCSPKTLQKYFGRAFANSKRKPTNSEYIAMLADRLQLQQREN